MAHWDRNAAGDVGGTVATLTGHLRYAPRDGVLDRWLVARTAAHPAPGHPPAFLDAGATRAAEAAPVLDGVEPDSTWGVGRADPGGWLPLPPGAIDGARPVAVAFCELVCRRATALTIAVTLPHGGRLWVAGTWHDVPAPATGVLDAWELPVTVARGVHGLVLESVAGKTGDPWFRACLHVGRGPDDVGAVHVRLGTTVPSIARRRAFETAASRMTVSTTVADLDHGVIVSWPASGSDEPGAGGMVPLHVRLQRPDGAILAFADVAAAPGTTIVLADPGTLGPGPLVVRAMPPAVEYYEAGFQARLDHPLMSLGRVRYDREDQRAWADRALDALDALAAWPDVPYACLARAARDGMVGLGHPRDDVGHPRDDVGLGAVADACLDPGVDATERASLALALLDHVARGHLGEAGRAVARRILTGHFARAGADGAPDASDHGLGGVIADATTVMGAHLFPRMVVGGVTANAAGRRAARRLVTWMRTTGRAGTRLGADPEAAGRLIAALVALVEHATAPGVFDLAGALLDRLLFQVALGARAGTPATAGGRLAEPWAIDGARSPLGGVARLVWGDGMITGHAPAVLALASAHAYEVPVTIAETGRHAWDAHVGTPLVERWGDAPGRVTETFRLGDAVLSTAVGEGHAFVGAPSGAESAVRAVLGPRAVVAFNHPGTGRAGDRSRASFWSGNGSPARIAQWRDTALGLFRIPPDHPYPYVHAAFPTPDLDEWAVTGKVAVGRSGTAYVALGCSADLVLVATGPLACRELRALGRTQAWAIQIGSRARDGDFASFVQRASHAVGDLLPTMAHGRTGDDVAITLRWEGAFEVAGEPAPAPLPGQLVTPFATMALPDDEMTITTATGMLTLQFGPRPAGRGVD